MLPLLYWHLFCHSMQPTHAEMPTCSPTKQPSFVPKTPTCPVALHVRKHLLVPKTWHLLSVCVYLNVRAVRHNTTPHHTCLCGMHALSIYLIATMRPIRNVGQVGGGNLMENYR